MLDGGQGQRWNLSCVGKVSRYAKRGAGQDQAEYSFVSSVGVWGFDPSGDHSERSDLPLDGTGSQVGARVRSCDSYHNQPPDGSLRCFESDRFASYWAVHLRRNWLLVATDWSEPESGPVPLESRLFHRKETAAGDQGDTMPADG